MTSEKYALSRSLSRLQQVEEELKNHLASLKHEHEVMKQYVQVCCPVRKEPNLVLLYSWNEVLMPGSSNDIHPEGSLTLERRKEAVVKKAKEYHKELEALLVPLNLYNNCKSTI